MIYLDYQAACGETIPKMPPGIIHGGAVNVKAKAMWQIPRF